MISLKVGDKAPAFDTTDQDGNAIKLSTFKGKKVVLYFYPKDNTPGCTIEAQDFTKKIKNFEDKDCFVFGISRDNTASHCKFVKKYGLAFN